MTLPRLDNATARHIFLDRHLLNRAPHGACDRADLAGLITGLGFVQLDSINTVARAHDMILFARRQAYRGGHLKRAHEQHRDVFEHWTHDAAVIPMQFYPHWRLKRDRDRLRLAKQWKEWGRDGFAQKFDTVLDHIRRHGPASTSDLGKDEARSSGGWWEWNPSKTALEFLWRRGDLAITARDGFRKIYDLSENVIPETLRNTHLDDGEIIDWALNAALDRLGFATPKELADFFDMVTLAEAKSWTQAETARGDLIEIDIIGADGQPRASFVRPDTVSEPANLADPPNRIRILSPFDPMLRDRARAERLFGFSYRIEVFVPAAKRQYGYYVFPILERDRMIGRIDMKRRDGVLHVAALWLEPGIRPGSGRLARLRAELARMARFSGCDDITFAPDWIK